MDLTLIKTSVLLSGPEIIIILGACVALMLSLVPRPGQGGLIAGLSLLMIALAAGMSATLGHMPQSAYQGMFVIDGIATYFKLLMYLGTALTVLISGGYLATENTDKGEYYVLLLFALSGAMIMVSGTDLLIIYIGIELQALSIYVLVGFLTRNRRSNEAALKYVILGAFSSGLLLFGLSLFYGLTGTTQLDAMAIALGNAETGDPLLVLATLLLLVGLLFKVGAVPFHMWLPDIYEGAPSPVTGFMSTVGKVAAFAVILRLLMHDLTSLAPIWRGAVVAVAVLTMAVGSLAALVQTNIKRMLAYSSIAHGGFLLLGLLAGGDDGMASVMFYLLVFTLMNLGLFAVIVLLNQGAAWGEPIWDFSGLAKSHPGLALITLVLLLSLAGIPPTGGFFAKFYVLVALVESGQVTLAVIAVLFSAVSAWFYLRIIMLMYMEETDHPAQVSMTPALRLALAVTLIGTVLTGLFPAMFLDAAQTAAQAATQAATQAVAQAGLG
ncbi:NADH-quinone oxidoreductase subunit N [Parasedimentitalea psychrophila]|uniref:NADH-quinone oxidoreductase subunit N n=1 Tax=Parasedimentitalea psychrophila TaxID=2997337 RepID=A0A9Y2P337_9RHOB|nr:NADH-quinone oxidoreductase subunit N [Parasedimentitalea psychrophila]WIY25667.1 NADH-quinone oxidoreductase subunit N [Parasedimentitalea psychrophila]